MDPSPLSFSPGSITAFFQPIFGETPILTMSKGLAFCVDRGVSASVTPALSHDIILNGESIALKTVLHVLDHLAPEPVRVFLETDLALGYGFGVSAACALSSAVAINRRFNLGRTRHELGLISHAAEVACRTGLGDVAAQLCGGVVFRHCENGPLDTTNMRYESYPKLYCRIFGELSTRDVLSTSSVVTAIREAGSRAVDWLTESKRSNVTIHELLNRSQLFAKETGLQTHPGVIQAIRSICEANGSATMVMLGHSVLATAPKHPGELWREFTIDTQGTRLI